MAADRFKRLPGKDKRYLDKKTGEIISTRERTKRAEAAGIVKHISKERRARENSKKAAKRELFREYVRSKEAVSKTGKVNKKRLQNSKEWQRLSKAALSSDSPERSSEMNKLLKRLMLKKDVPISVIEGYFDKRQLGPKGLTFRNRPGSKLR